MKASVFSLFEAINREGLNNQEWGLIEDIESTKEVFGTDRDETLQGKWLYVYLNTDKGVYNWLYDCLITDKAQKKLKSIWYRTEQPNIYIVLTQI